MSQSVTVRTVVDRRQPWLGLTSYSEADSELFFGREKEGLGLLRLVRREALTVLFGPSGTGKTSLLNAGLFPRLRESSFLPITIRLDHSSDRPDYVGQIRTVIANALHADTTLQIEEEALAPQQTPADQETLWEYLHRVVFWDRRNNPVTSVLVFDQFEETFTLGRNRAATEEFLTALADLVENYIPASVRLRMEASGGAIPFPHDQPKSKVVLSLREDFVWRLDSLRKFMPSVMHNRFAISRMNGEQALRAVREPGQGIVEGAVAQQIVRFVAAANQARDAADGDDVRPDSLQVDPALLSVVCRELNAHRIEQEKVQITEDLLEQAGTNILDDFYERGFSGLNPAVRVFVEDRLLTASGFRSTVPLEESAQAGIAAEDLRTLVDRRLIRFEERLGIPHLELTHDLLTKVVQKSRASRQEREHRERERQQRETEDRERAEKAAARERQERAELESAKRDLEQAQALAEEQQRRAEAERQKAEEQQKRLEEKARTASKLRRLILAVVAAGLLAVIAIFFAVHYINKAAAALRVADEKGKAAAAAEQVAIAKGEAAAAAQAVAQTMRRIADAKTSEAKKLELQVSAETEVALKQQALAETKEKANRQLLYAANIKLAQQAYGAGDFPRLQELLSTYLPDRAKAQEEDLRGFEWYHLWHLCLRGPRVVRGGSEAGPGSGQHAVAFSPDGKTLAATGQNTVSLWGTENWDIPPTSVDMKQQFSPFSHALAFSPDGGMLAVQSGGTVTLFDMHQRLKQDSFPVPESGSSGSLSFSPDSTVLAAAAGSNVILWDVAKRHEWHPPLESPSATVSFSPDGKTLAAGTPERVTLWSTTNWDEGSSLKTLGGGFRPLSFSPDGRLLAVGEGNVVKVWVWDAKKETWEEQKSEEKSNPITHPNLVLSIGFSPDGRTLASGSADGTAKLWDVGTGKEVKLPANFMTTSGYVFSVAFSPDGGSLATASVDGSVRLWDIRWRRDQVPIVRYGWAGFSRLALSPDGRTLAVGQKNGVIDFWDTDTRQLARSISAHTKNILSLAFSSDGRRLATGSEDKAVKVWDTNNFANPLFTLPTKGAVEFVALSPDGGSLGTGEKYESLKLWSMAEPHMMLRDFKGICDYPSSMGFLPDSNLILAGCNGSPKLLDWRNQTQLPTPKFSVSPGVVTVSPDGKTFAAPDGNDIVLWNTPDSVLRLKGHTGSVSSLAFSRDGTRLASGGYDFTVKIWEIHTGQELATFKDEDGGDLSIVTSLAFASDGSKLVIGSMSGDIRIWYAASPEEIAAQTPRK